MELVVSYEHPRGYVKKITLDNGETWELEGSCVQCGACCEQNDPVSWLDNGSGTCKALYYAKENGVEKAFCKIAWERPIGCVLWPREPYEKLPESCGYRWRRCD